MSNRPRFNIRYSRTRAALVLGAFVAYALAFVPAYRAAGAAGASLTVVPVAVAVFFMGLHAGLLAGLVSVPLNILLFNLAGASGWQIIFQQWPGVIIGVVAGVGAGWVGDLLHQLREQSKEVAREREALQAQIAERQKAEAALEQASRELTAADQRLQEQTAVHQRHASQLAVSAEVARVAASLHDLSELLQTTVTLISQRFNFYHAGIFLVDGAREWAVLQAASSPGGQRMLARGHRLRVGQQGIVGYVTGTGQPRIALDVGADAVHFVNPDLPETHSQMAAPLSSRGVAIGALDVQSVEVNAFTDEDVKVLQTLADQLSVAIDNARLFEATRRSLEELQALQRQARQAASPGGEAGPTAYLYDGVEVRPVAAGRQPEAEPASSLLQIPVRLGAEAFGILELKREGESWSADDVALSEAIADRMALALESARLFETTRVTLAETSRLYQATRAIAAAQNREDLLRAILAHALEPHFERFSIGLVELGPDRRVASLQVTAAWEAAGGAHYGLEDRYSAEQLPVLRLINPSAPTLIPSLDAPEVDERSRAIFQTQGLQALAGIPLVVGGAVTGVFLAGTRTPHVFTLEEVSPLQSLADQAAIAIENLRLLEETRQRVAELAAINSISQALTSQADLRDLLHTVGEKILQAFAVPNGYIALYDSQTRFIEIPFLAEGGQRTSV
ncbi:MAG: GAF domain-containing protein, partial [Chloroflexi bacterium]|nr:GAF domain-containing protein [Chloroflexota bacterium]